MLEVIAPFKHFNKLREFVQMKLPPGFPVKLGMCNCNCVYELEGNTAPTQNAFSLSLSPWQTSRFSPRSRRLSRFRNSATMNLRSLFSSSLISTKKIPAASLTSDLCTYLTRTGNDQRAKKFGLWETRTTSPAVFHSDVCHLLKKKKKNENEGAALFFLFSYYSVCCWFQSKSFQTDVKSPLKNAFCCK